MSNICSRSPRGGVGLKFKCFQMNTTNFLNVEFNCLKRTLFSNVWKRGIAIYTYSDDSLEFSLYNINIGQIVSPIVQLPKCSIFELTHNHDYASFHKQKIKSKTTLNYTLFR